MTLVGRPAVRPVRQKRFAGSEVSGQVALSKCARASMDSASQQASRSAVDHRDQSVSRARCCAALSCPSRMSGTRATVARPSAMRPARARRCGGLRSPARGRADRALSEKKRRCDERKAPGLRPRRHELCAVLRLGRARHGSVRDRAYPLSPRRPALSGVVRSSVRGVSRRRGREKCCAGEGNGSVSPASSGPRRP